MVQAAPIALRSAKAAVNAGLETDLAGGMKVEEQQYAKVPGSSPPASLFCYAQVLAPCLFLLAGCLLCLLALSACL